MNDYSKMVRSYEDQLMEAYTDISEMSIKLSFLPVYCDFIVKINQFYKGKFSTYQIVADFPLHSFANYIKLLANWNGQPIGCDAYGNEEYLNINIDDYYEIAAMIIFLGKYQFRNSVDLIKYFRQNQTDLKKLFPHIMAKFTTNKNEFIGLMPNIYELICYELDIPIKAGNAVIEKIIPLNECNDI